MVSLLQISSVEIDHLNRVVVLQTKNHLMISQLGSKKVSSMNYSLSKATTNMRSKLVLSSSCLVQERQPYEFIVFENRCMDYFEWNLEDPSAQPTIKSLLADEKISFVGFFEVDLVYKENNISSEQR